MNEWRQEQNARPVPKHNPVWIVAVIGVVFVLFAMGGSFFTARHMNQTADTHGMSAGRPGEEKPNLIQEQQNDKSARGPATTGQNTPSPVPPASR
jgi:hypothetical protein